MWELSLLQACLEEEDCVIIHVYLQDIIQMKRVGKSQGWSRLSQEWIKLINTQSAQDVPRGIKRSHGVVSIVNYALCTNPWSSWEFFVGLGCGVQVQVKRASSSKASRRDQMLEAIVVTMDLWRCAEGWLTHSGVWGSNQLVFIEPTQSRKVVHL